MKFRWRRHSAQAVDTVPAVPQLSHQQIFDIIRDHLGEHFGATGSWVVLQRTAADTDSIFQDFLTLSLSRELASALQPQAAAAPISPDWQPEPIAVWADHDSPAPVAVMAHVDSTIDAGMQGNAGTETTVERLVA